MRYGTSTTTQTGNGRKCVCLVQREQNWSPEDELCSAASPEQDNTSSGEEGGKGNCKEDIPACVFVFRCIYECMYRLYMSMYHVYIHVCVLIKKVKHSSPKLGRNYFYLSPTDHGWSEGAHLHTAGPAVVPEMTSPALHCSSHSPPPPEPLPSSPTTTRVHCHPPSSSCRVLVLSSTAGTTSGGR